MMLALELLNKTSQSRVLFPETAEMEILLDRPVLRGASQCGLLQTHDVVVEKPAALECRKPDGTLRLAKTAGDARQGATRSAWAANDVEVDVYFLDQLRAAPQCVVITPTLRDEKEFTKTRIKLSKCFTGRLLAIRCPIHIDERHSVIFGKPQHLIERIMSLTSNHAD